MPTRRLPDVFTCVGCGESITRKPAPDRDTRTVYCSLACKMRVWWQTHQRKDKSRARMDKVCQCGESITGNRKYCSSACEPKRYKARPPRTSQCLCCGADITLIGKSGPKHWCSQACYKTSPKAKQRKRIAKARRKARKRGALCENVDPYLVFQRDGWRCRLCGVRTPGRLRGRMADNAPELDHIVPLAKGGPHAYHNTQCLCRKCNLRKADAILGQFLLPMPVSDRPGGTCNV